METFEMHRGSQWVRNIWADRSEAPPGPAADCALASPLPQALTLLGPNGKTLSRGQRLPVPTPLS